MNNFKPRHETRGRKSVHDHSFIKQVLKELVLEKMTFAEAAVRHGLNRRLVYSWYRKFSDEIDLTEIIEVKTHESTVDQTELDILKKALSDAALKIVALETMINVAEEELKIDIRKKSGTKRFKE